MQYATVAGGAKGLSYWAYFPDNPKYGRRPQLDALGKTHRELARIGDQLALSHPVPLAQRVSPSGVVVKTLQSGRAGVAVIVINNNYTRTPFEQIAKDPRKNDVARFKPVGPVRINLRLPAWMKPRSAEIIDDTKTQPIALHTEGRDTVLELTHLEVAQLIWIAN